VGADFIAAKPSSRDQSHVSKIESSTGGTKVNELSKPG
jgi:hypothetical protein